MVREPDAVSAAVLRGVLQDAELTEPDRRVIERTLLERISDNVDRAGRPVDPAVLSDGLHQILGEVATSRRRGLVADGEWSEANVLSVLSWFCEHVHLYPLCPARD